MRYQGLLGVGDALPGRLLTFRGKRCATRRCATCAIQDDCQLITARLAQQLWEGGSGASEQAECVELPLALGEPSEELREVFLAHARGLLEEELRSLEAELGPLAPAPDVLEFTNHGGRKEGPGLVELLANVASSILSHMKASLAAVPLFTAKEKATISYILTLTDEQFLVKVQGLVKSLMLRKIVETWGWLSTLEPWNFMKRMVEDMTAIDLQVGLLYEEGVHKAQSKKTFSVDSSSRQQSHYAPSYTPSAPVDTNLLSNIQKLFSELTDVCSPVEFNKGSLLTGITKISMKTLLECVWPCTFGHFGLQQGQVGCHFLQLYLWHFVANEELVHLLLDEVVASAALRCPDPVPKEPSVVKVICERS
uniref:Vacuolar protein sorting-associated protein 51 homolog n=1 Tax=Pipistrellus kuhlii TaxID=59472 RepID=A0A7J7X021_PIPKU|nr:hypothetical protein mPipKuh1_010745 [Pipistrellus kuhlii]